MLVVVGSHAIRNWTTEWREPNDKDVWVDQEWVDKFGIPTQKGLDYKVIPSHILEMFTFSDNGHATLSEVYTIKCSHLGWNNPMWSKHKRDIIHLKSKFGCEINVELYEALVEFWKEELGDKSFLSLNKNKEEFFTDGVKYYYDHDYLHELVALPNKPVYTKCLVEGEDVLIDKDKFFSLPFEEQVRMFREEISVIACERWVIPHYKKGKDYSWFAAYINALQKTITNLTKGWATDFIVMNLDKFIHPEYSYFENILEMLDKEETNNVR